MRPNNIFHLGIKELRSLLQNTMLLVLIIYAFTAAIYAGSKAMPETLNQAPIAIVDEDQSTKLPAGSAGWPFAGHSTQH